MRRLRYILYAAFLLACAGGYILAGTSTGFNLVLQALRSFTPLQITTTSTSGSLLGGVDIKQLAIRSPQFDLEAGNAALRVDVMTLLFGRLDVTRLHLDQVNAAWHGGATGGGAGGLPLAVSVEDLQLQHLTVTAGDSRYRIDSVDAGLTAADATLTWQHLDIYAGGTTVHGDGQLQFGAQPRIGTSLAWTREQAGALPALSGDIRLLGDTGKLGVNLHLDQPFTGTAVFTLYDLPGRPHWEGRLSTGTLDPATLAGNLPDLHARLALQGSGDLESLQARGTVTVAAVNLPGMQVEATADNGELPLSLDVKASRGGGQFTATADLDWQQSGIRIRKQAIDLILPTGGLRLQLDRGAMTVQGQAPFALNGIQGRARLAASGDSTTVKLDSLTLDLQQGGGLQAQGSYDRTPGKAALQLSANWHDLDLPLGGRLLHSPGGSLQLSGIPDDYRVSASARLDGQSLPAASLRLDGSGDRNGLQLQTAELDVLNGKFAGSGGIGWDHGLSADLRFTAAGIDPGRFWPDWSGKLGGQGRLRVRQAGAAFRAALEQVDVKGSLRGKPISLGLDAVVEPGSISLSRARLDSGNAALQIQGRAGRDRSDLHWRIAVPDLSALLPDGSGSIHGQGHFAGTLQRPLLTAGLQLRDIHSPWISAGSAALDANIDLQDGDKVDLRLNTSGLAYHTFTLQQAQLQVTGSAGRHDYSLTAKSAGAELQLSGEGRYQGGAWQGRTGNLRLQLGDYGVWQLQDPVTTRVSRGRLTSDTLCLQNNNSAACLGGDWRDADHWNGSLTLQHVPLALGKAYFPDYLKADGDFDFDLHGRRQDGRLSARSSLSLSPGSVAFQIDVDKYQRFQYNSGGFTLTLDGDHLDGKLNLQFADTATPLQADLHLTGLRPLAPDLSAVQVRASASGAIDNLEFVSSITPVITDASGRLGLNLNLRGTAAQPQLSGAFKLADAGFYVPDLGIQVQNMNIQGSTTRAGKYEFAGQWQSGKGIARIKAQVQETPAGAPVLHATVTGKDTEIINLPEVWAVASPDLTLDMAPQRYAVRGSVLVSRGSINLDEIRTTTSVSGDVVLVDRPAGPKTAKLPPVNTDVTLKLGDDVNLKGHGISGKLQGQLGIRNGTEPGSLRGDGEIRIVNGKFSAYGQSLQIEEGRMIYQQAPLDNPELRVRAVRHVEDQDITAGVKVNGYLKDPQVNLFSSPVMDDQQVLSYIVFGRPLDSLSMGQGTDLISAATTLGLQNSGFLTSSLANTFGLSELRVKRTTETTGQTNTSLVVGKYLTPKLYLSYGIGLFQTLSTARLRYDISRHWSLQAEQGTETSADLLYKVGK